MGQRAALLRLLRSADAGPPGSRRQRPCMSTQLAACCCTPSAPGCRALLLPVRCTFVWLAMFLLPC